MGKTVPAFSSGQKLLASSNKMKTLYIFLDEAGNFDFSPKGSKYLMIGSLVKFRPFAEYPDLLNLKYDIIEAGFDHEYFHAAEDKKPVREGVFRIMQKHISDCSFVATVISKNKTDPALRPPEKIYSKLIGYNIRKALSFFQLSEIKEIVILADSVPIKKGKELFRKYLKHTLTQMLPQNLRYRIYNHASKSNLELQVVDYFTWATQRKWERGDDEAYRKIAPAVKSESDLFATEHTTYY